MDHYAVYLEIADDGRCMAHVPDLPGCTLQTMTRDEALRQLPGAIRDYHAWLRRHGEVAPPPDEPIAVEVAGEHIGVGPFDPGNAAALFPPDRQPLMPEEMEEHFRLMAHSRADLLALVQGLPGDLLDWQPDPGSFSIRRILRHIGNAEEWYVSRLVPPETLPPEWEDDEDLPLFEFLEMERRTAIARLRKLTDEERSRVFHPAHWTSRPDEAWTVRKSLRRFLEHEREHAAQIRGILDARRRWILARLAAERAGLLEQLLGLDARALTATSTLGDWTVKELLAHVAAWDRWQNGVMRAMVAGEEPDLTAGEDFDAANAAFVAPWRDQSLDAVLAELQAARQEWVAWLASLPVSQVFRRRSCGGYDWSFYADPVQAQWRHDAEHAEQIIAWREAEGPALSSSAPPAVDTAEETNDGAGAKAILLAALAAAREELLASAALVPASERASKRVCGEWTLQDVLGHIADWEWVGVEGLRCMAAGRAPQVEHVDDIDAWNLAHVGARRGQSWEAVWHELHAARTAFLDVLQGMRPADLQPSYPFPWGPQGTAYQWVSVYVRHDREHAEELEAGGRGS
jgi:uncharacterized damage-inducible protein DinB/predicted RNase H-like HicB family nuclease